MRDGKCLLGIQCHSWLEKGGAPINGGRSGNQFSCQEYACCPVDCSALRSSPVPTTTGTACAGLGAVPQSARRGRLRRRRKRRRARERDRDTCRTSSVLARARIACRRRRRMREREREEKRERGIERGVVKGRQGREGRRQIPWPPTTLQSCPHNNGRNHVNLVYLSLRA